MTDVPSPLDHDHESIKNNLIYLEEMSKNISKQVLRNGTKIDSVTEYFSTILDQISVVASKAAVTSEMLDRVDQYICDNLNSLRSEIKELRTEMASIKSITIGISKKLGIQVSD